MRFYLDIILASIGLLTLLLISRTFVTLTHHLNKENWAIFGMALYFINDSLWLVTLSIFGLDNWMIAWRVGYSLILAISFYRLSEELKV
jgi:hypothetical protein